MTSTTRPDPTEEFDVFANVLAGVYRDGRRVTRRGAARGFMVSQ